MKNSLHYSVLIVLSMAALWSGGCFSKTQPPAAGVVPKSSPTSAETVAPVTASSALNSTAGANAPASDIPYSNSLQMRMAWCPAGEFMMGSPPLEAPERYDNEGPVKVTLTKGFWIGKYEVTQGQWSKVETSTPWQPDPRDPPEFQKLAVVGVNYPVCKITWKQSMDFCAKLTDTEHAAGRLPADWAYMLPTEAQWEYACRAGTQTAYSFGDSPDNLGEYAWWGSLIEGSAKGQKGILEVGLKRPNPWGLYDMHGNAREYCRDAFVDKLPGGIDPYTPPKAKSQYAYRNGGTTASAGQCRSAYRFRTTAEYVTAGEIGFRLICVQVP